MLALGRTPTFPPDERLPDALPLDITRELTCPTSDEFNAYAAVNPLDPRIEHYRRHFGELPSETLRRVPGGNV